MHDLPDRAGAEGHDSASMRGGGRFGNGHPSIVPYTTYQAKDAMMALAVGNDNQFVRTAEVLGHPEWANDPRFKTNRARVDNRVAIDGMIEQALKGDRADAWLGKLKAAGVPHEAYFYTGTQHGFHNNSTPRYHEPSAKLSWDRTIAHFKKHLA